MTQFIETEAGQSSGMPAKMVIYGVPKIGKSSFASQADDVFFINIEGGLDYLAKKVRSTPKLNSIDEVIGWLMHIYEDDKFTCGTIAIDSIDWAEELAQAKMIAAHNAKSITDPAVKEFAYNKGVEAAAHQTMRIFKALDKIYEKKGIKSIIIAHSTIKTVDLPTSEPYSRHELKLSKYLAGKVNEWADLCLFADYSIHVAKADKNKKIGQTLSKPKAVLYAGGSAAFVGGGRMQLDEELPLDYNELKKHITKGK